MKIGRLEEKANNLIVYFVFSCSIVITILLNTMQKLEAKADYFDSVSVYNAKHIPEIPVRNLH